MRENGIHTIIKLRRKWQIINFAEIFLFALGLSLLIFFVFKSMIWAAAIFLISSIIFSVVRKPWKIGTDRVCRLIDHQIEETEYSSSLLLRENRDLTSIAQLQKEIIHDKLISQVDKIKIDNRLVSGFLWLCSCGILGYSFNYFVQRPLNPDKLSTEQIVQIDSVNALNKMPYIQKQEVIIDFPDYSRQKNRKTNDLNIKAIEGSKITWTLQFDQEIDSLFIEVSGEKLSINGKNRSYNRSLILNVSGFYNFKYFKQGEVVVSEIYSLEAVMDKGPRIEISGLDSFRSFEVSDKKELTLSAKITDDFGVSDAEIIATVTKGKGESVKFREERLGFDNKIKRGNTNLDLSKKIDLDKLGLSSGDELYFYIQARDIKSPEPNYARSETFFAVITDTIRDEFAVEANLGVDLMPDYFRSQRQIIIDTEKLIKQRKSLNRKDFESKSNELGFDQKSLRLKYGEFMGDESETFGAVVEDEEHEEEEHNALEEYTHDHDGANEQNLVPDHEHEEGEEEDPLEAFVHHHDDPEEATLFTQSLKSMLRQAMTEMWDAELYLRLYDPEKSLPYQYKALRLIQEIKNSARIYVHRIGFDPPPIKEENRLSGDLKEVKSYSKTEDLSREEEDIFIKKAINRLEELRVRSTILTDNDKVLFEEAGRELAQKAIDHPGKYLHTLQGLKTMTIENDIERSLLTEVQSGLYAALTTSNPELGRSERFSNEIDRLLMKQLSKNGE